MLHKLLGFSTIFLLLLTALFPRPSLCARGTVGLHHLLHGGHHPLHHEPHSSRIQMVIGKEDAGPNEEALLTFTRPSEHKANMNIPTPGHKANVLRLPIFVANELNANRAVPTQVALSTTVAPYEVNVAPLSGSSMGTSSPSMLERNPMYHSLAKDYIIPSLRRSLLAKHVSASDSNLLLQSGEDLSLSLVGLKATKDDNIFGMLPRAHRVPPSGPSKSHNSEVTKKST